MAEYRHVPLRWLLVGARLPHKDPKGRSYAELAVLPAARTAHKPAAVSFTAAAALPVAAGTAYDAIGQLGLTAGETLLILGVGGGVGVAAAQFARVAGVSVIGTASAAKREFVESLGVTVLPYDAGPVEYPGADAVLDLVGAAALRAAVLAPGCRVLTVADHATAEELGARPLSRRSTRQTLDELALRVADGRLDPRVRAVFSFGQAAEAVRTVESGHSWGKTVLTVTPG